MWLGWSDRHGWDPKERDIQTKNIGDDAGTAHVGAKGQLANRGSYNGGPLFNEGWLRGCPRTRAAATVHIAGTVSTRTIQQQDSTS